MSLILGSFQRNGLTTDSELLSRMAKRLHRPGHRPMEWSFHGITGLGYAAFHGEPLEHTRSIEDNLFSPDIFITADALLDNRDELSLKLQVTDRIHQLSDADLIILAYQKWGTKCASHLSGDYAFAIWDHKSKSLLISRDLFGVRPLFFYKSENVFAFASDIPGLFPLFGHSADVNEGRFAEFLIGVSAEDESTCWKGIYSLKPGSSILVKAGSIETVDLQTLSKFSESSVDWYERFRQLFYSSIRARSRNGGRLGSFLSGGIDSSAVTCGMRSVHGNVETYSNLYSAFPDCDESKYINSVLSGGHCTPHFRDVDTRRTLEDFRTLVRRQVVPFYGMGFFASGGTSAALASIGIDTIMDGLGGDEILFSIGLEYWLRDLARSSQWGELAHQLRKIPNKDFFWPGILAKWFLNYSTLSRIKKAIRLKSRFRSKQASSQPADFPPVFSLLDRKRVKEMNLVERYKDSKLNWPQKGKDENHAHHLLVSESIKVRPFETMHREFSNFGIEIRYPFFSRKLVELCLAAPPHIKNANGLSRSLVRESLREDMPELVQTRKTKAEFTPPLRSAFASVGKDDWKQFMSKAVSQHPNWFDHGELEKRVSDICNTQANMSFPMTAVWTPFVGLMWLTEQKDMAAGA